MQMGYSFNFSHLAFLFPQKMCQFLYFSFSIAGMVTLLVDDRKLSVCKNFCPDDT